MSKEQKIKDVGLKLARNRFFWYTASGLVMLAALLAREIGPQTTASDGQVKPQSRFVGAVSAVSRSATDADSSASTGPHGSRRQAFEAYRDTFRGGNVTGKKPTRPKPRERNRGGGNDLEEGADDTASVSPRGERASVLAAPGEEPRDRGDQPERARSQAPVTAASPVEPRDQSLDSLDAGLAQLEQGYQAAMTNLFGNRRTRRGGGASTATDPTDGNPFEDALDNSGSDGTGGDNPAPPDNSDDPDPGEDDPPADDTPDDPGNPDPGTGGGGDEPGEPDPTPVFNLMVLGQFPGHEGASILTPAALDEEGNLLFADSFRLSLSPGVVPLVLFNERQRVLLTDFNRDGLVDFLRIEEVPAVETAVELFVRSPLSGFELVASTALFLRKVRSAAFFDFNRDGEDELALLLDDERHLYIYGIEGNLFAYQREMVLPLSPGVLVRSADGAGVAEALYIIEADLEVVANITSIRPDAVRLTSSVPLNQMIVYDVDVSGGGQEENRLRAFVMSDRVVLVEDRNGQLDWFATVDRGNRVPRVIAGDYAGNGTRQILWVIR